MDYLIARDYDRDMVERAHSKSRSVPMDKALQEVIKQNNKK